MLHGRTAGSIRVPESKPKDGAGCSLETEIAWLQQSP